MFCILSHLIAVTERERERERERQREIADFKMIIRLTNGVFHGKQSNILRILFP